jgi:hypothetical protein
MNIPGFTAEASVYRASSDYFGAGFADSHGGAVIPAIPFCGNCDYILENCDRNGGRPYALCRMCETGNCFSGVERPPQLLDPFGHHPGGFF